MTLLETMNTGLTLPLLMALHGMKMSRSKMTLPKRLTQTEDALRSFGGLITWTIRTVVSEVAGGTALTSMFRRMCRNMRITLYEICHPVLSKGSSTIAVAPHPGPSLSIRILPP